MNASHCSLLVFREQSMILCSSLSLALVQQCHVQLDYVLLYYSSREPASQKGVCVCGSRCAIGVRLTPPGYVSPFVSHASFFRICLSDLCT